MKFYIKKLYIWFEKGIKPRTIEFENNKVNVVTGSSSTGKSNIYAIIDYCLLSGKVNIVHPVINENAQWYGLEFFIDGKFFAVARKKPTVEVVPPEVFIQHEIFASDFYPSNSNYHVNEARKLLNQTFGYCNNNQELLFRTCFVFNALTESIITSPYDFLNFKFFGDEKYELKAERNNLLQFVLTPNMEEYANVKREFDCLQVKKKDADRYLTNTTSVNNDFHNLLNELILKCFNANLVDSSILSQTPDEQMSFIEELLKEMSSEAMMQTSQMETELKDLQRKHSDKSIQLRNIERAKEEYDKYFLTLNQMEDSLKPITFIEEHLNIIGTNMWTSHIVNSLKKSLSMVAANKENTQQRPLVSNDLIASLQKQIVEIDTKIGEITKQKGALYKQVEALKVVGQIEAKHTQLQEYKAKKNKNDRKPKVLTPEDNSRMKLLKEKLEYLDQKNGSIIQDLNQCIQAIYDGLNYMEHYDNCYTKYELKQERLMLNDGKSIINYDVIGSQSNYMFLHLCFFLGLHRYFLDNISSQVGQFLFIDQPSIPYYAGSDDVKTTDKDKLLDAFKSIDLFMHHVIKEKEEEFQIILIEHAPESYWTGNNKLDYFITKATFTDGDALIPKYVIENK